MNSNPCSLCLESLNNGEWCTTLLCDHNLHTKCLNALKQSNNNTRCPLCRTPFYTSVNGISIDFDISSSNKLIIYYYGKRIVI